MKLIVGLGNPGDEYNFTRHNSGFLALDYYLKKRAITWEKKAKMGAIWAREGEVMFIKPQQFYNVSGLAVRAFSRFYKVDIRDILVVCDNFDLDFGKVRTKNRGVAGGNNGLKSVDKELSSSDYVKLRIGTKNEDLRGRMGDIKFVLSRFTPEEKERLPKILDEVVEKIDEFIE